MDTLFSEAWKVSFNQFVNTNGKAEYTLCWWKMTSVKDTVCRGFKTHTVSCMRLIFLQKEFQTTAEIWDDQLTMWLLLRPTAANQPIGKQQACNSVINVTKTQTITNSNGMYCSKICKTKCLEFQQRRKSSLGLVSEAHLHDMSFNTYPKLPC